jgi:hypothetical protein
MASSGPAEAAAHAWRFGAAGKCPAPGVLFRQTLHVFFPCKPSLVTGAESAIRGRGDEGCVPLD